MAAPSPTDGPNSTQVFEKICELLNTNNVTYKSLTHEPTLTSEDSAKARGEDLSIGGKAIIMKVDDKFLLFVLSASKKINSKSVKEHLKAKKIRFSTSQELADLCGLVPGSVPPFGEPILPLKLYVDEAIRVNDKIAFNAGSLTRSIIFDMKSYLEVAKPDIFAFSE
jgi:prolyl-tRNA editing enzyme YbaK/EbsC (Cys-tRNA(Pro) deacylase)